MYRTSGVTPASTCGDTTSDHSRGRGQGISGRPFSISNQSGQGNGSLVEAAGPEGATGTLPVAEPVSSVELLDLLR